MTIFIDESVLFVDKNLGAEGAKVYSYMWRTCHAKSLYMNKLKKFAEKKNYKIKIICLCKSKEEQQCKIDWCKNNIDISRNNIKIIKKHDQKITLAKPSSVLIDTKEDVVNRFIYSGGSAILLKYEKPFELKNFRFLFHRVSLDKKGSKLFIDESIPEEITSILHTQIPTQKETVCKCNFESDFLDRESCALVTHDIDFAEKAMVCNMNVILYKDNYLYNFSDTGNIRILNKFINAIEETSSDSIFEIIKNKLVYSLSSAINMKWEKVDENMPGRWKEIPRFYDHEYVYNECVRAVIARIDEFMKDNGKNFNKEKLDTEKVLKVLGEKYKSILDIYERFNEETKNYTSERTFDPISFLESYCLVENNTNGKGKNLFEKIIEHFKSVHNINLYDLPVSVCKSIFLFVFLNLLTTGLFSGKDENTIYK